MNYQGAKTKAQMMANLWGVNHVIVNVNGNYHVYKESEYKESYLELVEPVKEVVEEVKETKKKGKQNQVVEPNEDL